VLCEVVETATEPVACSDVAKHVKNNKIIVSLVFWFDLLHHINVVSKELQGSNINLKEAIELMERTLTWLQ
jgi:hypothetical protein